MRRVFRKAVLALAGALLVTPVIAQVGVWTSHLPTEGNVFLVTDPGIPDVVYTNVARSLDSGKTWEPLNVNPPPSSVGAGPAGTVYAGPGINATLLYKSTDSGQSWTSIPFSDGLEVIGPIQVDRVSPGNVYASGVRAPAGVGSLFPTTGILEKSIDGGQSWVSIDEGDPLGLAQGYQFTLALDPVHSGTLYASAPNGLFKSTDGGASWTALPPLPGQPGARLTAWVIDPFEPARMYGISSVSGQVLASADAGNHFVALPGIAGKAFSALALDPVRPNRIYAGITFASSAGALLGGVVLSDDGGMNWQEISNGYPTTGYFVTFSLAIDSRGRFLHAATSAGVYDYELPPDQGELFLGPGRAFSVALSATDQRTGRIGPGVAMPMNDLWGYFSIPAITGNPNNPEVFVKMLDGTALNGAYWFFYGGLTDLEYTLTVTDTVTGKQKTYSKPAGSECGGSDTAAFAP